MTTQATLAGSRATEVRSSIPAWGASYHDVTLDSAVTLTGRVTLVLADLTVQCTVLSGGPAASAGRSYYRVVAGAGGWGQEIQSKGYANDAGVKYVTILNDAASAIGETLLISTIPAPPAVTLDPYFTRPAGPACRVLEILSPSAWYIGEDGVTRLGSRPATTLGTKYASVSELDLARGTLTIASPTIAGILPGLQISGLTAVDVEHEWSQAAGLRSRIWGAQGTGTSRRLSALRKIIDQLDPSRPYRGVYEYRIVSQSGNRLNLQVVQVSTGMPNLNAVRVRPGIPGASAQQALGSRVLVGFVNADPGRPVVLSFEDADSGGFVPQSLSLAGGGPAIGRVGDLITISIAQFAAAGPSNSGGGVTITAPMQGKITSGSTIVKSG